nr:hypothetical protein [Tanacetum cinerariifolium]
MRQETWEMDQKIKKTEILTRLYGVTPMIVLRRNLFKARHVIQQHYGITTRKTKKEAKKVLQSVPIPGKTFVISTLHYTRSAEQQQELNEEEKAKLFMELLEKRRKFFATKRAKKRGIDHPQKLNKDLFDKAMKRVNTFIDYTTELVEESSKKVEAKITQEESSKRVGEELEQETAKKQKIVNDKETTNLK